MKISHCSFMSVVPCSVTMHASYQVLLRNWTFCVLHANYVVLEIITKTLKWKCWTLTKESGQPEWKNI
jgi:hypothetical protein